ncbi:PAS domain S-box protein [Natronomonas salina]|uniref:PAS domain-containing sensor histidine kinase n=1 Tax=Natronomonas salina TaxID=1710540 RepID=UPI0015B3A52E|nr:PAS domain S-box protein [Natronomonas salina]QLD89958.1 PAS domain S-box protein [Natronomonas salina]
MEDAASVRLLVAGTDRQRASAVAGAIEASGERFEVRTAASDGVREALTAFDADCVAGDAADAAAILDILAAERPELPVVLFYGASRAADGDATAADAGGQVVDVVRVPDVTSGAADPGGSGATADGAVADLLDSVESAVDRRDRKWYRSLLDSTSDVIAVLGSGGEFQYVNRTVEPMLGYEPAELVGRSAFEFIHEDDREAVLERFFDFTAERGPANPTETFRIEDADGRWRYVESTGQSRFSDDGMEGYVICAREVSERRRREQELARFETIVETAPVGLFVLDEDGVITWANRDYAETLAIPRAELVGTPFPDLVAAGYYDESVPEEYLEAARTLLSSGNDVDEVSYPVETYRGEGEPRLHDAHITLLPLEDGEFRGTVVAYRDVTKQREYEAELERQNERLDRFASTVSHDLRNPLSVAKGRVQLARETGDLEHLDHVAEAHDRMESLVEGLLSLARDEGRGDESEPVSLAETAASAWESIDDAAASLSTAADVTVVADPSRLRQLFENLFRNSVEHGAVDGEPVSVTVGPLDDREGFYVADDGRGIPPADRDRVFDHGYTTVESGTGFGLGIVRTVAEDHGWTVSLAESDGGGARFEVETGGDSGADPFER